MDWSSIEVVKVLYRLLRVRGMGAVRANKLLFSVRNKVASVMELQREISARLNEEQNAAFMQDYEISNKLSEVHFLSILDEKYPKSLVRELGNNSPTVLSYRGNVALLSKNIIGFSGSRKVSDKGISIAADIATQLSNHDFCLVSGYANGVDMIAHKTALANGASTILVLPEGISYFYIRKEIAPYWNWDRVLVISEFEPQAKWMVSRAMQRNRTLIALSQAMLVIEAGEKGGSLDAGLKTIDYGKRLFVPQYAEFPISALGNEVLIQHGAYPLRMKRSDRKTNLDMLYASVANMQPATSLFY